MSYITGTCIGLGFGIILGYFGYHYIMNTTSVQTPSGTFEEACEKFCTNDVCIDCNKRFP